MLFLLYYYIHQFYQMFDKMHKEKAIYVNALSMSGEYSFKDYLESVLNILVSKIVIKHFRLQR